MAVTLIELQQACYRILCKLDDICKENELQIVLQSGTTLGAVRHKGFIPWDDDIDVMMPYRDYKKLKKIFKKSNNIIENYSLSDFELDHESPHCLARVRFNNSFVPEPGTEGLNINCGIWLDIFTYCYCAQNKKLEKIQSYLLGLTMMLHEKYRNRYKIKNGDTSPNSILVYRIADKMPETIRIALIKLLQNSIALLGTKKSGRYFCMCDYIHKFHTIDCRIFDDTIPCKFVEREFEIPKDYDWYLSRNYGSDYMTPRKTLVHANVDRVEIYQEA